MGLVVQRGGGASLSGYVPTSRTISVSGLGLSGGGDLSADRTITLTSNNNYPSGAAIPATDASGILRVLQTFVGANPATANLQSVYVNFTNTSIANVVNGIAIDGTLNFANGFETGQTVTLSVPSGGAGKSLTGLQFTLSRNDSSSFATQGILGQARTLGSTGYTGLIAGGSLTGSNTGAGTCAEVRGGIMIASTVLAGRTTKQTPLQVVSNGNNASSVIDEVRGIDISGWVYNASATVTVSYGIYADTSIDKGTTKYFIYSLSTSPSLFSGNVQLAEGVNLVLGTTTGTKIGTATSQKIGLWNATPIVQPTTAIAAATFVANTSGIVDDTATWDGYTIGQVVKALRNTGALA